VTNWEKWFGNPREAALSVVEIADYLIGLSSGSDCVRGVMMHLCPIGDCPTGLGDESELAAWLEDEAE